MGDDKGWGCVVMCFAAVAFVCGLALGWRFSAAMERSMAIGADVGRYITDPKTGVTTFHYGAEAP